MSLPKNLTAQDLETWMFANKLTLNSTKTEYMIIGSNKRVNTEPCLHIKDRESNRVQITY